MTTPYSQARRPRAVLFDMDDTLICHDGVCDAAWRECFATYAPRLGLGHQELRDIIYPYKDWYWSNPERHRLGRLDLDRARRELVRGALQAWADASNRDGIMDIATEMADEYTKRQDDLMYPLPGCHELLDGLRAHSLRLSLITNGSPKRQRPKIERFGLLGRFDQIFIEGEFGVGKPDPRVFNAALEGLRLGPEECVMVGDSLSHDVAGAAALGIGTVWVNLYGKARSRDDAMPDYEIHAIDELPSLPIFRI